MSLDQFRLRCLAELFGRVLDPNWIVITDTYLLLKQIIKIDKIIEYFKCKNI